ncbi:hypothetical protein DUNSADRAFT_16402 [Dunaliella salina]|uniref:Encoded protein n=1 Tax=Dunaliella salina TaxID=3046 RepID=A0ABQ7G3M0_DUNSA|nr:hypothetical protein DUNSADRAFT_16402 [Dunaliella salina]|eukprot:KAF5829210.1 hypothetical protein DUNSADRAFT_16402 [Dunaliella salina]
MLCSKGVFLGNSWTVHPIFPTCHTTFHSSSRWPCSLSRLLSWRRCLPPVCAAPNFEGQARRPKKGRSAPSGESNRKLSSTSDSSNVQQKRGQKSSSSPALAGEGTPARLAKMHGKHK